MIRRSMNSGIAGILVVLTLQASVASAAGEDDAKAKALFDEARDLAKANKWAEACEKLAASKRLVPRMLTTYRLADCHERVGKTASAHAGFLEAADLAKATGDSVKRQDAVDRAKKVEGKLARITLEIAGDGASLAIRIDDTAIASALFHEKIPMDPGEHTLTANAPGKLEQKVTFTVPQGPSTTTVTIPALDAEAKAIEKPVASAPAEPPPIDDTQPVVAPSNTLKTVGFVSLGVGVVGLAIGGALGLSAKSLDGDAEALCTARGCTPEGKAMNDDARSRGNLATVVFTAGALIAVTGVVLIIAAPSNKPPAMTARVSPWMAPGAGGFSLAGSF